MRQKSAIAMLAAALSVSCGGALKGGTIGSGPGLPTPLPPAGVAFDLVPCRDAVVENYCPGMAGVKFTITPLGLSDSPRVQLGDPVSGYAWVPAIPATWTLVSIAIDAPGYVPFSINSQTADLVAENAAGRHNFFGLKSAHVDPSSIPLAQLAAIRGAMWPLGTAGSCGAVPLGPRPGQADNVIATVFITDYAADVQDCIIAELKARGYTHVVMGPLVDSDGYHGIWQPNDWRGTNFERFLDAVQKFWDNGLAPVVFIKPDNWPLAQAKAELTPLLSSARARRLLRIVVPMGWEAGAAYEYSSCTWAEAGRWMREALPDPLVLVHMVSDRDAPAGTDALCDDDDHAWNPGGNAAAWARVAPFYHGWLTQSGAFDNPSGTGGDREHPELTNFQNWQRQFDPAVHGSYRDRFEHGYAGWPTFSAWSATSPLLVFAGEFKAYWTFWQHRTEAEGVTWGDAAMKAGAAGYLDSGSVPVPVRR